MDVNNYAMNTASVTYWYLALKHKLELSGAYPAHVKHTGGVIKFYFMCMTTTYTCIRSYSKSRDGHKKVGSSIKTGVAKPHVSTCFLPT